MGYCIRLVSSDFKINKENIEAAFQALKKLGNGSNDDRAHGGSEYEKNFSWMNGVDAEQWQNFENAMDDWRYPVKLDQEGNCVKISFNGEKIGQEDIMFNTIAPYVEKDSSISMVGEDGHRWHWIFDGETCKESPE